MSCVYWVPSTAELLRRSDFAGLYRKVSLLSPNPVTLTGIQSNSQIFDFTIEQEDMDILDTLNQDFHSSHIPEDLRDVIF